MMSNISDLCTKVYIFNCVQTDFTLYCCYLCLLRVSLIGDMNCFSFLSFLKEL